MRPPIGKRADYRSWRFDVSHLKPAGRAVEPQQTYEISTGRELEQQKSVF